MEASNQTGKQPLDSVPYYRVYNNSLMKSLVLSHIVHYWHLIGRWLLFVILALGLAKTPLAYSCTPVQDTDNGSTRTQLTNTGAPCHTPNPLLPPPTPERECCLINIDNGLRGSESGFILSPLQAAKIADEPAALPTVETDFSSRTGFIKLAVPEIPKNFSATKQPPYLLTQRLRI